MIMLPSGVSGSLLESDEPSLYGVFNGGILSSPDDINLRSGDGVNYLFTYNGLDFNAEYTYSSWKVYNSYRIVNSNDIEIICTALSNEHPVPDRDYISYRTPADMTFEWMQHNIAYNQLPEGNHWKYDAQNVDLDPQDQGRSFQEIYESRTGNKLDILEIRDMIIERIRAFLGL